MDHAETVAKHLLERLVAGARMTYQARQSQGEHDFDLNHPNGSVFPVEVTSSVDRGLEETHDAILNRSRDGAAIKTEFCKHSWHIHPSRNARINQIRKEADKYLAAIECAGIETFWGPTDSHASVEAIYHDLGVMSGSVADWVRPGFILLALPGIGGAIGATTVIDSVEREAFKSDNRRKLGNQIADERHLAIYISMMNHPWTALVDFEPPSQLPNLPPEITHVWAFSEARKPQEYAVWQAAASLPWQKIKLSLTI